MNRKLIPQPLKGTTKNACARANPAPEACTTQPAFTIPAEYQRAPVDRLLRMSEVTMLTGMCRSSVYNRLRDGDFVPSVQVGPRSIRFPESEVRAWIAQRVEERDRKEGCND